MGSFYPAQTGGPDNTVYWLTKALQRAGHQAVVSSTDNGLPAEVPRGRWLDRDYARVIYTRNPVHYLPWNAVGKAREQLAAADVLHLTMITYPAAWLMALANGRKYRKPIVWSVRGDLDPPMLLRSRRKKAAVIELVRAIERRQDVTFHTTCDEESAYVREAIGQHVRTVQIPNYMELPERVYPPKEKLFVFVGRIDPKKGIENLLEAVSMSEAFRQNGYRLELAGDATGEYGASLRGLAHGLGLDEVVSFLGHVGGADKEHLLARAHCLVMPSHTENFGIVVTEALAQGTPAIASTGTPWRVLDETGAGWWAGNDPESLVKAMEAAMALSPEAYAGMSKAGVSLAANRFDIYARIGEWERLYRSIG